IPLTRMMLAVVAATLPAGTCADIQNKRSKSKLRLRRAYVGKPLAFLWIAHAMEGRRHWARQKIGQERKAAVKLNSGNLGLIQESSSGRRNIHSRAVRASVELPNPQVATA